MASSDLSQNIKSGILSSGDSRVYVPSNRPEQYVSRQKEYFAKRTASFREKKLQYGSDFFKGRVQGIDPDDPYKWVETKFRMAEVVRPSSAIQRDFDDYKMVMMEDPAIDYIPHVEPRKRIRTRGNRHRQAVQSRVESPGLLREHSL